ncbi:MAG: type II toxin-antitoxin system HipA family toxin [Prosthecobacter sp.]
MPRPPRHHPLRIHLNGVLVGHLTQETGGGMTFRYDTSWLEGGKGAISLSLPLQADPSRGERVNAVFDNLLPDNEALRRRVAERVGARATDAFSLLYKIGRDCVGALQFVPADEDDGYLSLPSKGVEGTPVSDKEIEQILAHLGQAPLGLGEDNDFRISVAGAQEKTALLWHGDRWLKPRGTTPTTHIFKTQMGKLRNGMDLSQSVENEFYCLRLMRAFGLPACHAEMHVFGKTKALVVERFDRRWLKDGRLLRLPQEDCCQALSKPPTLKYQNVGGPSMVDVLNLLKGADTPAEDQKKFLKAQILFWLIGATDGHAKNFSLFLRPNGGFSLTPLYDVLSAQPCLDARQLLRKEMKMAMCVGDNRHYRMDEIHGRHFLQTTKRAGLPERLAREALDEVTATVESALTNAEAELPARFPAGIPHSVRKAVEARRGRLST